jgi:peptidoglycan/xylan/chitin deacetylase (PgdA/CDA1 family)
MIMRRYNFLTRELIFPGLYFLGLVLYALRLHRLLIWLRRRSPTVLAYHACEVGSTPFIVGRRYVLTPDAFAAQLDFLCSVYNVVDLAALEAGVAPPDRAVAITIDDGLRSTHTRMLPALQAHAVPARVYLVTGVLNNAGLIWMHELAWVLRTYPAIARTVAAPILGTARDAPIEAFLTRARNRCQAVQVERLLTELRGELGYDPATVAAGAGLYLGDADLAELAKAGVSFGNHTVSHYDLARLDSGTCASEILGAATRLADVPGSVPSLAFPFGRRNEETRRVALALGMGSLAEVGGSNTRFDRTRIARVSVTHQSVGGLFAQMAVVEPAKAWLARARARRSGTGGSDGCREK